jgi:hypothetical protein
MLETQNLPTPSQQQSKGTESMRKYLATLSFCLALALASVSHAATMSVSNQTILPNTPNQIINIFGSGGETIVGMELAVHVVPNGNEGPMITSLQITGPGTLLGDITNGANPGPLPGNPRVWVTDALAREPLTATLTNTLPIGILTIDTTGVFASSQAKNFVLNLNPTQSSVSSVYLISSDSGILTPTFTNGILTIAAVPEPSTVILAGLGGIALVLVGARRSRSR